MSYGSKFEDDTALFYSDQWGLRMTTDNVGMLAVGYFDDGFDPVDASQNLNSTGVDPLLAAFNILDSKSSFDADTTTGFITGSKQIDDEGAGKTPYVLLLAGISSIENAAQTTGIGLFTDSSFSPFPVGTSPIPSDYSIEALSYDTVLLGTSQTTTEPSSGMVYLPVSLGVPPLALLASSESLAESWWNSSWFGVYSVHANSPWLYHQFYGWVFPSSTSSVGLWFWEPTQYGWIFQNSPTYPYLWADSIETWLYPNQDSSVISFWHWNSQSQEWELP